MSSAEVLWESFGTETQPAIGDIIKSVSYEDGYVAFQTPDLYKEGNAVIAVKNAEGNILWSYHIWLTDAPQGQEYFNNAGIMMDRNLGATSSIPGDSGTIGLHYQWGRKDPFLGSTSITSASIAKSTITWPEAVESDSTYGTIEYATANPTVFILGDNPTNKDWYYTGARNTDHTRWTSSKTIYDPCPAGWRVPDGHQYGVWAKAIGTYESFEYAFDGDNKGMNLSGKYGSDATIWYPAAGYYADGKLMYVSTLGGAWSISPTNSYTEFCLYIQNSGKVYPAISAFRAYGMNVRCIQE